jgi:hypothetical protein
LFLASMAGERVHAVINNYPGNRPRPRAWSIVGKMPHCAETRRSPDCNGTERSEPKQK